MNDELTNQGSNSDGATGGFVIRFSARVRSKFAESPCPLNARMNELTPVFNCVTFREAGTKPVRQFAASIPGDINGRVEAEQFDFEVWTKDASVISIEAIRTRLDALLNQSTISLGPAGRVFWSERTITSADNWDPQLLARFGLFRYRLLVEYTV